MGDEFGEALVNFLPLLRIPSRSDFIHTGFSLARVPLKTFGTMVRSCRGGFNLGIKMNLYLDLKIRILNMVYSLILSLFNQLECPTWNFL